MNYLVSLFMLLSMQLIEIQLFAQQDSIIDDVGDIAFVAWSSSNQDGFAFVLLDDCPNGTQIKFVDEEWTGSSFYTSNGEGENTWTNSTGNYVTKGTVVIVQNANHNPTVNVGSITESDAGFDIAASSPDQIFAFVGSRSSPTFISMIGHTTLPNNGSGAVQTLSGTGLTSGSSAVHLTSESVYTGNTSCTTLSACNQMLNSSSNWQALSASLQFPNDVDTIFGGSALPVVFTSLSYELMDNAIELNWSTALEFNNRGFSIQRRTETRPWEEIGFVQGNGTTFNLNNYEFKDRMVKPGLRYFYRLEQKDFNGDKAFSKIISVVLNPLKTNFLYWYCLSYGLHIVSDEDKLKEVELYNCSGRLLRRKKCSKNEVALSCRGIAEKVLYAIVKMENTTKTLRIVLE